MPCCRRHQCAVVCMYDATHFELLGKLRIISDLVAIVELDEQTSEAGLNGLDAVAAHRLNAG